MVDSTAIFKLLKINVVKGSLSHSVWKFSNVAGFGIRVRVN